MADPTDMTAAFAAAVAGRRADDTARERVEAMTAAYAAAVKARSAEREAASAAADAAAKYGVFARAVQAAEQRQRQFAAAVENGTYQRHAAVVVGLNRQYDLMAAKVANQARAADLASGAFARHAAAMAAVNRQAATLNQMEQTQALVAEKGRYGAFREMARPHLQTLGMVAGMGSAAAMGMVRSGFSGTAEGAAFSYQWERLNRQLAAIAIPVFEKIAKTVGQVALWFERLDGAQQNQIMKVGVVVVGLVTLAGVVKTATWALGALAGTARAAAAVMGASAVGSVAAGTAGAVAGGALAAGGAGGAAAAAGRGRAGGLLAAGSRLALPLAAAATAYEAATGGYYETLRGRGVSRVGSAFGAIGGGFMDLVSTPMKWAGLTDETYGEAFRRREGIGAGGAAAARRDVTPMGTALMEAGSTAQQIQEELLRATVARSTEREELTTTIAGLVGPVERIARIVEERGADDEGIRRLMRLAER